MNNLHIVHSKAPAAAAVAAAAGVVERTHRVPQRLSGPISAFSFDLPTADARRPHRIYVFGDAHFSYANTCRGCERDPACATIIEFIDGVAAAVRAGTCPSLDVHVEFPLYKGVSRAAQLRTFDAYIRRDASPTRRARAAAGERAAAARGSRAERVSREDDHVIGVIGALYHKYGAAVYGHHERPTGGVRFHMADARHEDNARAVFDKHLRTQEWIVAFHRHLPTAAHVSQMLRVFLFGRDFVADMARMFPAGAFKPVLSALSRAVGAAGGHTHKIAKQFHKLPTQALQQSVRAYIELRLAELERLLRQDLGYDDAARFIVELVGTDVRKAQGVSQRMSQGKSQHMSQGKSQQRKSQGKRKGAAQDDVPIDLAPYAYTARVGRMREYLASAFDSSDPSSREGVFDWPVRVLLMDAYLLCRMLRFAHASPGGVSVAYTGDMHAAFYVRFLRDHLHLTPLQCHTRRPTTPSPAPATVSARGTGFSRCVPMTKACETPAESGARRHTRRTRHVRQRVSAMSLMPLPGEGDQEDAAHVALDQARRIASRLLLSHSSSV